MEALFDLPKPPRPAPPRPAFTAPPIRMPALPLSCRACKRPLEDPWCDHSDLDPFGPAADRIIADVKAERDRRRTT